MAAADVIGTLFGQESGMSWTATTPMVEPAIQQQPSQRVLSPTESFNPSKHLRFVPPSKVHSMEELGFSDRHGVSPVAVSEPFPLFTQEAVMQMRSEVLSKQVRDGFCVHSNLGQNMLRGFVNKCAPFCYEVWKSPEVLRIVSQIAGIDLVPAMDLEIAHINVSEKEAKPTTEQIQAFQAANDADDDNEKPVIAWHTDSYPFVCVTMLSDCSQMVGGETALRTGTGEVMKVRGPQMGCAVILQGRYIEHQALRSLGGTERITMVTSFRPKNPLIRDDTRLTTVRPITNLRELYAQFSEYRLEMLEERIRAALKEIRESRAAGRNVSTQKLKLFLDEQQRFLEQTNGEILDEDKVTAGFIDDSHLFTKEKEDEAARLAKAPRPGDAL